MVRYSSLPPECIIRQACATDNLAMYQFNALRFVRSSVIYTLISTFGLFWVIYGRIGSIQASILLSFMTAIFMVLPIWALFSVIFFRNWQQNWSDTWLIECDRRLVAYAHFSGKGSYSLLNYLYVKPDHRRRGLGSYLVQSLAQHAVRPIYLITSPELVRFYICLGFIPIHKRKLPQELQSWDIVLGLL